MADHAGRRDLRIVVTVVTVYMQIVCQYIYTVFNTPPQSNGLYLQHIDWNEKLEMSM